MAPVPNPGSRLVDTGVRTKERAWGARLTGRAAVAALPADLLGRHITVTDSGSRTWTTTITDIVSRNDGAIVVRNSGGPEGTPTPPAAAKSPGPPQADDTAVTPALRALAPVVAAGVCAAETTTPSAITSAGIEHIWRLSYDKSRPPAHAGQGAGHGDPASEEACRDAGQGHSRTCRARPGRGRHRTREARPGDGRVQLDFLRRADQLLRARGGSSWPC